MNDEDAHRAPLISISILHAGAVNATRYLVPSAPPNLGAVRSSLNPIAAHRHAAPSPRMRPGAVQKHQNAARSLAGADQPEVCMTNEIADRLGDR
jgi:hypothetical protein